LDDDRLATFVEGLRVITIAPELRGAPELIRRLADLGVRVSLGHSAATLPESRAGYDAGAVTTTHLFNAMSGVVHREPGLALAALLDDTVWVELIADTLHVDPELWPLIWNLKPVERVLLVSDAIALAGSGASRGMLGELEVRLDGEMVTLVEGGNLAGSVSALDLELRNVVRAGIPLAHAVRAASRNPAELLGLTDRGRLAPGLRADLVVLDADSFAVRRVMRAGEWIVTA
ncbi:MAG: amidohydrolase family protein, partial [Candidatus Limnocylindrales bacterium]